MGKLGFHVSFSFAFASFEHCVFFCGVWRSIEWSVRGLQVVRAVFAGRLCSGCGGRGLQVESRLLRVESASRVYRAPTLRRLASLITLDTTTWEDMTTIKEQFPNFNLEDKVVLT